MRTLICYTTIVMFLTMLHKQFTKSNVKSVKLISHMILIKYGELTQCLCKGGRDGQEGGPWLVSTVGCLVKFFQEFSSLALL